LYEGGEAVYDYVIVGAGSAGCVLASRLSEDPHVSVLLLEAGGPDNKQEIHIPAAFAKLFKTTFDWNYETEPQPHLNNRKLYWPRGKVLGGSSSMNAMLYVRGNRHDYDEWGELGNPGWAFADVLPYFKKAEHYERGGSDYAGRDGPLNVAEQRSINPLTRVFVDAAVEAGLPRIDDFNGSTQEGVSIPLVTQKGGTRNSTAVAYLRPALKRPNLTVQTQALAAKLLVEGKRVVGVAYLRNGAQEEVRASREVIVCGGAVNSPQLLLLSGIGPADHLKALGIDVIADLPGVGQNLQDHLAGGILYNCTQPITLASAGGPVDILNYLLFKKGPLTSIVAESEAFFKTKDDLLVPDVELLFAAAFFLEHGFTTPPGHGFSIGVALLHPESRGSLTLRSTNPTDPPAIQPNYFASETDVKVMIAGMRRARQIGQAKAFDPYRGTEYLPGEAVQSDAELAEFLRTHAETLYHPVGTCKMGEDSLAVVDANLCVRGVEGLSVVDASVMPTIISGHTNAPTIMIAEKGADLIKGRAAAFAGAASGESRHL
jgi:choline dehydrogenase